MEATASDSTLAATEKTCGTCGRTQPIGEFRFRDQAKGLRHTTCNTCFAGYHRGYRDTKRRRELKTYVDELATDPSNPRSYGALSRAEVVLRAMLKRFGGLERFADDWFSFIRVAIVAGKHHVVQRRKAMLRLMELVDRNQPNQGDQIRNMREDELREFMTREFVHKIYREPEVGIVPLEVLGFKVERPDEPPVESLPAVCEAVRQRLPGLFASTGRGPLSVGDLATCEEEEEDL